MQSTRIMDVPGLMYLWQLDNLYLAGQPTPESMAALKDMGVKKVFNLRGSSEMDFGWEEEALKQLGIEYEQFPIVTEKGLDPENCARLSNQINDQDRFFIHCGTANRVGGWLITYLVERKNMDFEDAVEVAMNSGLTNPAFIDQAMQALQAKNS